MANIIANLDLNFELLREQKLAILKILWKEENSESPLWGLVHLIDDIQDQAVENNGIAEELVFGESTCE